MARSADDERLIVKFGFYGCFIDMVRRANVLWGDFRRVWVEEIADYVDAAPIDAFHPNCK